MKINLKPMMAIGVIVVLAAAFALVPPVRAAYQFTINSVAISSCAGSASFSVNETIEMNPSGTASVQVTNVSNAMTGLLISATATVPLQTVPFETYGTWSNGPIILPAGTALGDTIVITYGINGALTSVSFVCAVGSPALSPYSPPSGGGGGFVWRDDGRLNAMSLAGPIVLYCSADDSETNTADSIDVYWIDPATGAGSLVFRVTAEIVAAISGQEGVFELASWQEPGGGYVKLYRLTTGELQAMSPAGEGKVYVFIFNGCPYNGQGYYANFDPAEGTD